MDEDEPGAKGLRVKRRLFDDMGRDVGKVNEGDDRLHKSKKKLNEFPATPSNLTRNCESKRVFVDRCPKRPCERPCQPCGRPAANALPLQLHAFMNTAAANRIESTKVTAVLADSVAVPWRD